MEYQRIKYFLAAAECLNFTRAANKLFISQQSITKQIYLLEQELGVRLFERSTRSVRLTPAGEVCYKEFFEIDKSIAKAVINVRRADQEQHTEISIGFFSFFSADCVIRPIMRKLRETAPNVNFHVHLYDMFVLEEKFSSRKLDLCVTTSFRWRRWKDVSVVPIISEPFYVTLSASHPLASKERITADDLKNVAFFVVRDRGALAEDEHIEPIPCHHVEVVDNFDTLKMRLELGEGCAALTRVFEGALDSHFVYFPVPIEKELRAEVVCAFDPGNTKPVVRTLAESLTGLKLTFD